MDDKVTETRRSYDSIEDLLADGPDGIGFVHRGTVIVNPFRDESCRHAVNPTYYGFRPEGTGGGCMAYVRYAPQDERIEHMLTEPEGVDLPEDDTEDWLLSMRGVDGNDEWLMVVDEDGRVTITEYSYEAKS